MVLPITHFPESEPEITLYLGIDIGQKRHCVSFSIEKRESGDKRILHIRTEYIDNNSTGFEKLSQRIHSHHAHTIYALLEHTGHYGDAIVEFLHERNIKLYIVNIQERELTDKTDRNDAHFLSDMLYQQTALGIRPIKPDQRIRQIVQIGSDIKQLQQLVRRHCELTESLVRTKNRLRELLNRLFPEFTDAIGDPNTPTALRIRVEYPTPAAIAQASIGDLFACRPKTAKKPTNAVLMRLHQLAAVSVGVTGADVESICLEQRQLIHTLHLFSAQIDELEQAITVLIGQSREGQILQSLPMISPLRAAYLLAGIGCIANFPKASKLCAYVGWAPRRTQTGSSRDSMRISRAGNRTLKSMMYLLTLEAVRRDTVWRDIYKQLVERKCPYDGRLQRRTGRMKVIVRIGNQIVRLIYLLLKKDYDLRQSLPEGAELPPPTLYDPSYHQARRTVSKKNSLKL